MTDAAERPCMTVGQLITKLQAMPQELVVLVNTWDGLVSLRRDPVVVDAYYHKDRRDGHLTWHEEYYPECQTPEDDADYGILREKAVAI